MLDLKPKNKGSRTPPDLTTRNGSLASTSGLMSLAAIWGKNRSLATRPWQVSKKVVAAFPPNTLFLNVIVCLLFLSLHNLFFDLRSQTICYCFTALKISFEKRHQRAVTDSEHQSCQDLQAPPEEGVLKHVFRTLTKRPGSTWVFLGMGLLFTSKCFLSLRVLLLVIWAKKHQHHRLMFSEVTDKKGAQSKFCLKSSDQCQDYLR